MNEIKIIFNSILGIVLFAGILYLAYISTKFIARRYSLNGKSSKNMKILETLSIGKDSSLILVKVGNKNLLIGSTPHSVNIVDQFSDDEIICDADSVNCTEQKLPDFAEALKINIAKKFGKNTAASARKEDENDKKSNS